MQSACAILAFLLAAPVFAQTGEGLFLSHCAVCHGAQGEGGRGPMLTRSNLRNAPDDEALHRVIRRGIPNSGMPSTGLADREVRLVAAHVRTLGRVPPTPLRGNAENGAVLYRTKGQCAQCHTLHGRGGSFGPDLTAIGTRRSPAYLRTSLTDPSADFPRDFVPLRAVTSGGQSVTGSRVNEDTFSLQLRDASGRLHSWFKSELREWKIDKTRSPMPSYRSTLTDSELDDLTAFLAGLMEPHQ